MELKLNIYHKNEAGAWAIEKVYTAETIDIMFGTAEDLIGLLDGFDLNDTNKLVSMVTKGFAQLKPFLKEIFIGLTDDELRRTKVREIVPLFVNIFTYIFKEINATNSGNAKN